MPQTISRVFLIVLDSVGIGELPDAARYGDEGSSTLGNLAREIPLRLPTLRSLGLDQLVSLGGANTIPPVGAYGRLAERSPGKDSVTGHWELMGIVLEQPFPTFPSGFPPEVIAEFERRIGRGSLGNVVASGTEIIDRLGPLHMETGKPIVYTSADSVFQIAAHEEVIPVPELYRMCEAAFEQVGKGMGVGRVIARPFVGQPGSFKRTANRHDYALDPMGETLLDVLTRHSLPVLAIGKVQDLFAGRGIAQAVHTGSDAEGMDAIDAACRSVTSGLDFANLVDFDVHYRSEEHTSEFQSH